MNDDQSLRPLQLVAVKCQVRGRLSLRVQLGGGQQGIESLFIEVMEADGVPAAFERAAGGLGDGVVEAAPLGMGKNDGDFHR